MELTQDLARCLDLEPSDTQARRLLHHLPEWARPVPDIDLAAVGDELASRGPVPFGARYFHYMDRPRALSTPRFPLATSTVTFAAIDTLELHDIIVERYIHNSYQPSRSAGLGSAALKHLCRSADHYGEHCLQDHAR